MLVFYFIKIATPLGGLVTFRLRSTEYSTDVHERSQRQASLFSAGFRSLNRGLEEVKITVLSILSPSASVTACTDGLVLPSQIPPSTTWWTHMPSPPIHAGLPQKAVVALMSVSPAVSQATCLILYVQVTLGLPSAGILITTPSKDSMMRKSR